MKRKGWGVKVVSIDRSWFSEMSLLIFISFWRTLALWTAKNWFKRLKHKNTRLFLKATSRETACVACYSLRYNQKPRCRVLVYKCTDTPLHRTLILKKENITDFLCDSLPRSGVSQHLYSETWPAASLIILRRRTQGPNHEQLLFLTPHLASLCILQQQIRSTKWCRLPHQKLKRGYATQLILKTLP